MPTIKIKTPAKINLTLEVLNKRPDGFHNLQSIMHAISLYDYLTIKIEDGEGIYLSGTSDEIPYDQRNIAHKAAKEFLEATNISDKKISIHIEKNIPVSAGLAGGSTNAAGVLWGLNKLFGNPLTSEKLHAIAAKLGSDLNFCLEGGAALCTSRGEIIEKLASADFKVSLIKPKNLGISAKEAYQKFALLKDKTNPDNTSKLKELLLTGEFDSKLIYNSLEKAILPDYKILSELKENIPNSMMSGSGPTFFVLNDTIPNTFEEKDFAIFNNLDSIPNGVEEV